MNDDERKEMLRLVELEYDRTTKFIDGWVGVTTSLRGWAITVWAGLVGIAFSAKIPALALLAVIAVIAFALVDAYYSSLYQQTLRRARELERITNQHFDALARGADNPRLGAAADSALAAHSYGLYTNMRAASLRNALQRPQRFFWIYAALAALAIAATVAAAAIPSVTTVPASLTSTVTPQASSTR